MRGPAIFLAQFMGDNAPFNALDSICRWAAELGYVGIQIPTWESRLIDLQKAAESKDYCDEWLAKIHAHGLEVTELSTHLQGQLMAVHPAYDAMFDAFAPESVRGNPSGRLAWAEQQLMWAARASANLGLEAHATFSGAFLWHTMYPWPQRLSGLVELGFTKLAERWRPILNAFDENGVDLCYEIHPGEDLHDGITFERFLDQVDGHPRACMLYDPSHLWLQQIDYVRFIDHYHDRIKMFHVKDAELNPTGKSGVYGGYQSWRDRPGRFRSIGDGQIDFSKVFSKFYHYGYTGWAVLEWECYIKNAAQGAAEGSAFIRKHMMTIADRAFDDFTGSKADDAKNRSILGL